MSCPVDLHKHLDCFSSFVSREPLLDVYTNDINNQCYFQPIYFFSKLKTHWIVTQKPRYNDQLYFFLMKEVQSINISVHMQRVKSKKLSEKKNSHDVQIPETLLKHNNKVFVLCSLPPQYKLCVQTLWRSVTGLHNDMRDVANCEEPHMFSVRTNDDACIL